MLANAGDRYTLTVPEVAVVANVPLRYVNQVIEEKVLPAELFIASGKRRFMPSAAAFVAFNRTWSKFLTRDARHLVYARLIRRYHSKLVEDIGWNGLRSSFENEPIDGDAVKIDVTAIFREVADRLDQLEESRMCVVSDPEILSGTPVLKGTRIPVHDIAASVDDKIPLDRIMAAYGGVDGPDISAREIGIAYIWAKANPLMGRPRKFATAPHEVIMSKRVPRKRSAD